MSSWLVGWALAHAAISVILNEVKDLDREWKNDLVRRPDPSPSAQDDRVPKYLSQAHQICEYSVGLRIRSVMFETVSL